MLNNGKPGDQYSSAGVVLEKNGQIADVEPEMSQRVFDISM